MPTPADGIGSGRWPLTELWDFKHTRGTDWLTAAISAGGELGSRSGSWTSIKLCGLKQARDASDPDWFTLSVSELLIGRG